MRTVIYSAPAVEPVDLDEAKLHLRLDGGEHNALLNSLIAAARLNLEETYGVRMITQTWDLYLDTFPGNDRIVMPYIPLASISGVYYTPDGGSEATFAASNYVVDNKSEPGQIVLKSSASWPGDTLEPANGVRIRFVCGYGASGASIPAPIKQALLLLMGHLYEHPELYEVGPVMAVPFSVNSLMANYRNWHF